MEASSNYININRTGRILVVLSASLFFLTSALDIDSDNYFGLFALNFLFTIIYAITLMTTGAVRAGRNGMQRVFLFLILFLISAYSLNRTLPVFEESATWLGILLVILCAVYMMIPYLRQLPRILQQVIAGIIGIGLALWLYLSVYLLPLYLFGAAVFFVFGVSLHAFVPLLFLIFTIKWMVQQWPAVKRLQWGFYSGFGISALIVTLFCAQWSSLARYTEQQYQRSLIAENTDLPAWIKVSRRLPDNWVTERFLKANLVYSTPSQSGNFGFWNMPTRRLDEVRRHDPLVMMAALVSHHTPLSESDRIKILESKYDARHKTEERLWSGANLRTEAVLTNAIIWPALRIAYTEKTITVSNKAGQERWQPQQEAIYNFHLPEGSVVTSLSLWIDGHEAKGVLTSKGKADTAYRQIVGVERHDPSVVHWQEGNTVSVRVFPVVAGSNRVAKIGITTPLTLAGNRLLYKPLTFEGPVADGARELLQIAVNGTLQHPTGLNDFEQDEKGRFTNERQYDEDWKLSFDAPPVQEASFAFNNAAYTLRPYVPSRQPATFSRIYLDVNAAWTKQEYDAVCALAKGKKLYAFTDEMIHIDGNNHDKVFSKLHCSSFSLFPTFSIKDPGAALLITKGTERSPNISDLAESPFAVQLGNSLKSGEKLRLYNLGDALSPFFKTLKERRAFHYEHGNTEQLKELLDKGIFAQSTETDRSIVIDDAGISITRTNNTTTVNAPDHLMRLFAYNHLMQEVSAGKADSLLVAEASEAYVVSPLSSLVVLETAADYQRFGIEDNKNSLHNAVIKSNGAVPEPHEWALIIIAVGIIAWYGYRHRLIPKAVRA